MPYVQFYTEYLESRYGIELDDVKAIETEQVKSINKKLQNIYS